MLDRFQFAVQDPVHKIFFIAPFDGKLERHDLLQDQAEREDIRSGVGRLPVQHFRREIPRRPADFLIIAIVVGFSDHLGKSPVHDVDFHEFAEHDVFRLEVPVDDVPVVRVSDGIAHPQKNFQPFPHLGAFIEIFDPLDTIVQGNVPQIIPQRTPVDQLHAQVDAFPVIAGQSVNRDDRRMVQLGRDFCFGDKGFHDFRLLFGFLLQGFDGNNPPQVPVAGYGNRCLTALREFLQHGIPGGQVAQRRFQLGRGVRLVIGVAGNVGYSDEILKLQLFTDKTLRDPLERGRLIGGLSDFRVGDDYCPIEL